MKNLISHCHLFSHLFNSRYQGNYRFSFISEPPYSHGQLSETRKKFKPIFITLLAAMLPLFPRCRWSVLVSRKRLAVEFGSIERGSFGIHQLDVVPPGPQVMDKSCKHWTFTRKKGKLCQSETFQLRVLMGVCVRGVLWVRMCPILTNWRTNFEHSRKVQICSAVFHSCNPSSSVSELLTPPD